VELVPVKMASTSQAFAAQLRQAILEGEVLDGEALPTERSLAEQTGIGRSSVREALRTLEAEGLISTRPGRGGGAVVRRPDMKSMAHSIDVFVRGRNVLYATVLEARQLIEPGAARLAALHRTDADVEELRALHEELLCAHKADDIEAFVEGNLAWHIAIYQASHNELITGFMLGLTSVLRAAIDEAEFHTSVLRLETLKAHGRVFEAVVEQDAAAAERRMSRHLHAHEDVYLPRFGQRSIVVTPHALADEPVAGQDVS
jgi:GntR family transcriptional regulator, transcriptional repressor for pyruvate dehydrogenase complex